MRDRGWRRYSMSQIEDMWAILKGVKDLINSRYHHLSAFYQTQRVKITLNRNMFRYILVHPDRICHVINCQSVYSGLFNIGDDAFANALWKTNDRLLITSITERGNYLVNWRDNNFLPVRSWYSACPAVK